MKFKHLSLSILILLSLLLVSCAVPRTKQAVTQEKQPNQEQLDKADALEEQGSLAEAADVYWAYAEQLQPPQREEWQIHAADILIQTGAKDQAQYYLERIDETPLTPEMLVTKRLLNAKLAIINGDSSEVLRALPVSILGRSDQHDAEILELRARALEEISQNLESVKTRIALSSLLTNPFDSTTNNQAIWQTLSSSSNEQLLGWLRIEANPILLGWLELAHIDKNPPVALDELKQQLARWQQSYPLHIANEQVVQSIITDWQDLQLQPQQIALLLPMTGNLAKLGQALHSGILAAQLNDENPNKAALRVYDTGDASLSIQSIYARAVAEGAGLVIGPLQKESVEKLAASQELPIPVLSLNTLETSQPTLENLFQFGLLPEDEARQAAERASLDGHAAAIVFVPDGDWGARLAFAFNNRFEELGGTTLTTEFYPADQADFSTQIKHALDLDQSQQRYQTLQGTLQRKLVYEPHPRQDADMIFIAGTPLQARLMKPQLKFNYASNLPVYATSHIYSGLADPAADQDIDGIIFCDMPWILNPQQTDPALVQQLEFRFPDALQQLPRFAALGADAYRVIPYLKRLAKQNYERYSGVTGILFSDSMQRIHRELKWARFQNGKAILLGGPADTENLTVIQP